MKFPPAIVQGILALGSVSGSLAAADRPNILFLAVDDLVPVLGCYGDPVARTPQIDSLASQGTTFLNHHCQWAVCGPSRAALSTSLMPEETNVMGFKKIRDKNFLPNVTTLPQHFRNNGYETACTGKFHDPRTVGTPVETSATYPDGVMDNGTTVDDPASWSVPYVNAGSGYSPAGRPSVDSTDQADSLYEDHKIMSKGLDLIDDLTAPGGSAPGNKPFFLAIGFKKPHLPFVVAKRYWDIFDRNAMPLATFTTPPANCSTYNAGTLTDNGELDGSSGDATDGYAPYNTTPALLDDPAQQRELIHGYYACAAFIDNLVGQIRAKLAATDDPNQPGRKLSETTIVVLWGDHGFHLGDHGHWAKHTAMEQGTSSPLIIFDPRSPKNASNNKTDRAVGTIDIYPTLCELAGLSVPQQPSTSGTSYGRPLRGRSLVPLINNPVTTVHQGVVSQFNANGQYGYAYRTDRFRYIEWINLTGNMNDGNLRRELYDYQNDPLETVNVAADPAYAAIVYQLSRSMRAETTVRGTGRLLAAAPIATGGDAYLPDARISVTGANATLSWPASGGVSYNILASTSLATGSWGTDFTNLQGPSATFPMVGDRRFFRIGFGANTPPRFLSDPQTAPLAVAGSAYAATLAGTATDPGDTLAYSKIAGPAWLTVAPNGTLGGTPSVTDSTAANYFTVQVADASGCFSQAALQITVADPATNQPPVFAADPITAPDAATGVPYAATLGGYASDPDMGQTPYLTYSKTGGPSWLTVAADGTLGGTPAIGNTGANTFTVRATDPLGAYAEATLGIAVAGGFIGTVQEITRANCAASGIDYGSVFFSNITVQAGDLLVVSHAPNKNTALNTITLSGLGPNTVQSVNSGSSGTTSAGWVFYSPITSTGTYSITLETTNATKTVSQSTSVIVLRATAGTLQIAGTDGSVVSASPGATSLALDFTLSPPSSAAYGIAAATVNASVISAMPAGWTADKTSGTGGVKRGTYYNPSVSGSSHTATFGTTAASDIALAGIVVEAVP